MANDGGKKKRKKKYAEKGDKNVEEKKEKIVNAEEIPKKVEAQEGEVAVDSYRSSAVAFFTRNQKGEVERVLVALEERKVQASLLNPAEKGKITKQMVVFPMGRREKKDKSDCVETAKREYIEETTNFGGLAKYLDFADFDGGNVDADSRQAAEWTGKQNLALFFAPASMTVLFCEVPVAACESSTASTSSTGPSAAQAEDDEGSASKKRRKDADSVVKKPSPNYHVGKTDHLQPQWISALQLKTAVDSGERAPLLRANGSEYLFFPTVISALRQPEARVWLGLPPKPASSTEK